MQRRQFLQMSAGGLGAIALSQCASGSPSSRLARMDAVYRSQDGLLDIQLDARMSPLSLGETPQPRLSYGGRIPGPLLDIHPGDTVRIQFRNHLNTPTNLHFHGLHISPTDNADNPFLEIPAGDRHTYEFTLPANHHSVTAYYHPHLHGYVAQQIFAGLGGVLRVRGALDEHPLIQAATDEVLFLKDFDPADNATATATDPYYGIDMMGREGSLLTANGQVNPHLAIAQGGLLRLRIINASTSHFYRLALEEHPFHLIATDGGALAAPESMEELLLSPGERADVLIHGDRPPGRYRLLALPYTRVGMGMGMGMGMRGRGNGMMNHGNGHMRHGRPDTPLDSPQNAPQNASQNSPQTLATLQYNGRQDPLPLPDALVPIDPLPAPQQIRQFTLNHGMVPGQGMMFLINGRAFDHHHTDTTVRLNTVEDWEIVNTGVMDHPFHIHTNRFQVISHNGQPMPYPIWKDTVLVPIGDTVRIRIPFQDYAGRTVYHCHILDHEDLGMMGTLDIQPASQTETEPSPVSEARAI